MKVFGAFDVLLQDSRNKIPVTSILLRESCNSMSGVSFAQSARVQELSSIVFGQRHRLAVMAAIAQSDGLVNPTDLASDLDFRAQSAIQQPLKSLEAAGLITRVDGAGRVYYRRNQHTLWEAALELLSQALADDVATSQSE